jgi:hypothetical protein
MCGKISMVTFNKTGKSTAHVTRRPTDRLLRYLAWINVDEDPRHFSQLIEIGNTVVRAQMRFWRDTVGARNWT